MKNATFTINKVRENILKSSREVSEAPHTPQITPIVQVQQWPVDNVYLDCGHSLGFVSMS